jgi:hypothetical protein
MSFLRHQEIYPFDEGAVARGHALAHRTDEFPVGYSLAGCSPALPASASPTGTSMLWLEQKAKAFAANGTLSLISLSHPKGAVPSTVQFLERTFELGHS